MAWNDPEIGIEWSELKGEYKDSGKCRRLHTGRWYSTEPE